MYIAWNRDEKLDSILPPGFALLSAFPYFFTAMILLYVFGFKYGWFPIRHAYSSDLTPEFSIPFIMSALYHAFLPASTLVFMGIGGWMLQMRNNMITTISTDYISFAKARGLSERRIMFYYAAKNAILPIITSFGMAIGFALNGAILTEIIFSYPGQGYILFEAVKSQDFQLMQGIFLTITLSVLAANWIIDILVLALDPRTRK
jgi:peptide/nickel transport system permease protein